MRDSVPRHATEISPCAIPSQPLPPPAFAVAGAGGRAGLSEAQARPVGDDDHGSKAPPRRRHEVDAVHRRVGPEGDDRHGRRHATEMCSKSDMRRDGATLIGDSVCKLGDSTMVTSHSVMTMQGDTAYKTERQRRLRPAVHGHEGLRDDHRRQVRRRLPGRTAARRHGHAQRPEDNMKNIAGAKPPTPHSVPPATRSSLPSQRPRHEPQPPLSPCRNSSSPAAPPASSTRCPRSSAAGVGKVSRLPVSIRIVLESVLRNCDGKKVTEEHVRSSPNWAPTGARTDEIPFVVARVVLQDFTGVPLLADLAAMRNVASGHGQESQGHRAAGAGRPGRRPLGDDRPLRHEGRARPQHEARVPAQQRALRVHEVGHAGVRHVQRRAAGHRHRAPGEPRIPGARRAHRRTASTTRTRWSAPTATRR